MAFSLITTCVSVSGGTNPVVGAGEDTQITVGGTWALNDTFTIQLTNGSTSFQTQIGAGNVSNIPFNYCFTFGNKVFGLNAATMYCSAIAAPTVWNDPNATGNGYITMSNFYSTNENLLAGVPYQGYLAFFSRRTAQIWVTDSDLSNWSLQQILTNIGTVAGLSVQSLGDLDVLFLSDTGIRSLRVRDQSLNAYVNDIGSPIDSLIQTALLSGNPSAACAVIEPQANRYWCYLNGVIYVLSYFPSAKISAWGTYMPTYANNLTPSAGIYPGGGSVTYPSVVGRTYYWAKGAHETSISDGVATYINSQSFTAQGVTLTQVGIVGQTVTSIVEEQTPFVPQKFLIFDGQVYCRDATQFYVYGGANNNTYDGCIAIAATSWLDGKAPTERKQSYGLDTAFQGAWTFAMSMDQLSGTMTTVASPTSSTFQKGSYDYSADGFHIKFQAQTTSNVYSRISNLIFNYAQGDEKS